MSEIQDINVEISEETIAVEIVEETIEASLSETEISVIIAEETIECSITEEVIEAELGTEDIVVEVENWSCPEVIESGSGGGFIFITDVTTSGSSGDKVYEPDTVPEDYVLTSLTVDNASCEVFFIAEGGENYSPTVTIDGVECTNLTEISQDKRVFSGSIPVTVDESGEFTVESSTGKEATVTINRAAAPPDILSVIIGDYPGLQTAAKAGDQIEVSGTVDEDATEVRLVGGDAFDDSEWVSCSGGVFTITGTVSSLSGLQSATVYARNAIGSEGPETVSSNQITLDQAVPTFTDEGVTFPSGQSAFKGTEVGTQSTIVSDFTNIVYSSPHGDFSMSETATYAEDKEITCTNPGDYNDSSVNFRIYAYKASNDTDATFEKVIEVADVTPVVTVTQPQTRLRSSESGQTYTITASSNQNLADTPSLTIPVSGTWQGSGFVGGPKIFTRTILITDADVKGESAWDFDGAAVANKAGILATITGTQNVGGFVERDIILPAFGTIATLTTEVVDVNKLSLTWSFKDGMTYNEIGTLSPVVGGWTIDAVNTNPTQIIILDTQAASSSSQSSILNIREEV